MILLRGYKIVALALATAASGLPATLLYIYFIPSNSLSCDSIQDIGVRETSRRLFSFGIYSFVASIANVIRFRVDALVVASYVGLAAVTHYRIGSTLTQLFMG